MMGSFLEQVGYESLRREAEAFLRDIQRDIQLHITAEMEKHMAPLNESIARLQAALDKENADDAVILAARDQAIADLEAERAQGDVVEADLATATQAIDDASARLGENDLSEPPVEEPPVEEPEVPAEPTEPEPVDPTVPEEPQQ